MKNFLLSFLLVFSVVISGIGQIPNGTIAPNFTATDLDGNVHVLSDYLNSGIHVVIDISATWCGPCWSYHNSGTLENFYNSYGPNGTGEVMVLFIEGDPSTNLACLYGPSGCVGGTQGNWVAGTPYPIIHTEGPSIRNAYQIAGYPTVFMISAGNNKSYTTGGGATPTSILNNYVLQSFKMSAVENVTDAVCGGDGAISLDIIAGYGAKSYSWSNGMTTKDITNLEPGGYVCTITDANGYDITTDLIIVGGVYAPVTASQVGFEEPTCFAGTNGSVTIQAVLGNSGYSYAWDDGQSTQTKMNIGAGEHFVTVTDGLGCLFETSVFLTEPTEVVASAAAPGIPCGQSTGTATLVGSGGAGSYMYDIGFGPQSSGIFNDLSPNTYNYTVADNQGCIYSNSFELTAQTGPLAAAASSGIVTCANTTVQVSGTGSEVGANVSYQWTTQNGTIVSGANQIDAVVSAGGTYTLQVSDSGTGCSTTAETIVPADIAQPSLAVTGGELTCLVNTVQMCATTDPGLTVNWTINGQNTQGSCATVTSPGSYPASVTGANGCSSVMSAVVTADNSLPQVSISAPAVLTCTLTETSLQGSVIGDPADFNITWMTADGNIVSGANTLTPTVNADGLYSMQVTNISSGCVTNSSVSVTESINTPNGTYQYAINAGSFTGQAASSGSGNTYLWDFGNGSTSTEANPSITFATPGTYNVCLTVTNECGSNTSCQTVTYSTVLGANVQSTNVTCHGENNGRITAIVNGGESPYTYAWTGPNGFTSSEANILGLAPGIYTLVITDAANGTYTQTITITEPTDIKTSTVSIVNDNNGQNQGSVYMVTTGGTGNLTYLWSNGQTTQDLSGVGAGDYTCVVTDENGCTKLMGPFTVQNISSVNEAKYINAINVYPNPATNQLNLEVDFVNKGSVNVSFINGLGNNVLNKNYSGNIADNVDVSSLASGVYLINIQGKDFNISRRVVILK